MDGDAGSPPLYFPLMYPSFRWPTSSPVKLVTWRPKRFPRLDNDISGEREIPRLRGWNFGRIDIIGDVRPGALPGHTGASKSGSIHGTYGRCRRIEAIYASA